MILTDASSDHCKNNLFHMYWIAGNYTDHIFEPIQRDMTVYRRMPGTCTATDRDRCEEGWGPTIPPEGPPGM
jgi:hypothetical protein